MISRLAKRTAYFFVEKRVIENEDVEAYAYGMELLYSLLLNMVLAGSVAIVTGTVFPTAVFLITFIGIRQYIGGYHAKTHFGCMSILAVVLCCFSVLVRWTPNLFELWISAMAVGVSVILVFRFAPVEHPNKPLSSNEKVRLRKRGLYTVFAVSMLVAVMIQFTVTRRYGMYLSLGQLTASLAMLGESVKHKMNHDRWKNEEEKVS